MKKYQEYKEIKLSEIASSKFYDIAKGLMDFLLGFGGIAGIFSLFMSVVGFKSMWPIYIWGFIFFLGLISAKLIWGKKWKNQRWEVLKENALDFYRSVRLNSLLERFKNVKFDEFPIIDKELSNEW